MHRYASQRAVEKCSSDLGKTQKMVASVLYRFHENMRVFDELINIGIIESCRLSCVFWVFVNVTEIEAVRLYFGSKSCSLEVLVV